MKEFETAGRFRATLLVLMVSLIGACGEVDPRTGRVEYELTITPDAVVTRMEPQTVEFGKTFVDVIEPQFPIEGTNAGFSLSIDYFNNCPNPDYFACEYWRFAPTPGVTQPGTYAVFTGAASEPLDLFAYMRYGGNTTWPRGLFATVLPEQTPESNGIRLVSLGFDHGHVLAMEEGAAGELHGWGANDSLELGLPAASGPSTLASVPCANGGQGNPVCQDVLPAHVYPAQNSLPVRIPATFAARIEQLATGGGKASWFANEFAFPFKRVVIGVLPYELVDGPNDYDGFSLALLDDGSVWGWGNNRRGQLGQADVAESRQPLRIPDLADVQQLAAGIDFGAALTSSGDVWVWGGEQQLAPTRMGALGTVGSITASEDKLVAILRDGTARYVSRRDFGQVETLDGLENVQQMSLAFDDRGIFGEVTSFSWFALLADGTVHEWSRSGTQPLDGLSDVIEITSGNRFLVARLADGSLKTLGDNQFGERGNESRQLDQEAQFNYAITDVVGLAAVQSVVARENQILATQDCNVGAPLWSWGENESGNLGRGFLVPPYGNISFRHDYEHRPVPVYGIGGGPECAAKLVYIFVTGEGRGAVTSEAGPVECGVRHPAGQYCWLTAIDQQQITLTAIAEEGSSFRNWLWDCQSSVAMTNVDGSRNQTCKVEFVTGGAPPVEGDLLSVVIEGNGAVESEPAGIRCRTDCNEVYPSGTEVRLVALPAAGWRFVGFSGAGCESGLVTMNGDLTCTATFEAQSPDEVTLFLTLTGPGDGTGNARVSDVTTGENECTLSGGATNVSCEWQYPGGIPITLLGENFVSGGTVNWIEGCANGSGQLPDDECRFEMNQNREVLVRFE